MIMTKDPRLFPLLAANVRSASGQALNVMKTEGIGSCSQPGQAPAGSEAGLRQHSQVEPVLCLEVRTPPELRPDTLVIM